MPKLAGKCPVTMSTATGSHVCVRTYVRTYPPTYIVRGPHQCHFIPVLRSVWDLGTNVLNQLHQRHSCLLIPAADHIMHEGEGVLRAECE